MPNRLLPHFKHGAAGTAGTGAQTAWCTATMAPDTPLIAVGSYLESAWPRRQDQLLETLEKVFVVSNLGTSGSMTIAGSVYARCEYVGTIGTQGLMGQWTLVGAIAAVGSGSASYLTTSVPLDGWRVDVQTSAGGNVPYKVSVHGYPH